ncbi:hypothetical protein HaLaN_00453 [Haematococcus lacustris]|uniref:Uncharacterized protein n=1 Tax=Haematococcus lacustris TaxID=44745 RepID=A0A699Y9C4_HAELA|nr:hypothetical protein HaLaN_00453 [Haematococcus lacustris]
MQECVAVTMTGQDGLWPVCQVPPISAECQQQFAASRLAVHPCPIEMLAPLARSSSSRPSSDGRTVSWHWPMGAAGFSGSGSVGCWGVPVSQMLKEALRQLPAGRVLMVDAFRTSRVSSAYSNPSEALPGQPLESFRWLRPVHSSAKRSQARGLMCSTSNNIR